MARKKHAYLGVAQARGGRVLPGGASPPYRTIGLLKKKFAEIFEILEFRTLDVSRDFSFGHPQKRHRPRSTVVILEQRMAEFATAAAPNFNSVGELPRDVKLVEESVGA